jgi:DNA damage-inducible protein 1
MEYNPESFGRVVMLYIDMSVNGIPIKAFVDSGAQATIISPQLADKCGIMHLLDDRFSGTAHGVGTAKILGRIHSAPIRVGNIFLPCSFTVMENKGVEFLFGLDMLRRHQASIDLSKNVLRIGDQEVAFLAEHEIPAADRFEEKGEQYAKDGEAKKGETASSSSTAAAVPKPASAATSSAPLAASSSTAPPPVPAKYSEASIKTLTDLGVSRTEAIGALDMCGGNVDMAASMLF